jgi:mannonate dehydratase
MNRRQFLTSAAALGVAAACGVSFDEGLVNPCLAGPVPEHLLNHEITRAAWVGIEATKLWDVHVHLAGTGSSESGIWISPKMRTWLHPWQSLQRRTYLNAACIRHSERADQEFLQRLLQCLEAFPIGAKAVLLAFDFNYDEQGRRRQDLSAFHIPNSYAARTVSGRPDRLEWVCSVHPYRVDAVDELERCAADGAVAVKWLPSAMGIDPASPRCDRFYAVLARRRLPLLTHGGEEMAVHGAKFHEFNSPLRLRRPLDQGVRVIVAHCASLGSHEDLDTKGRMSPAFQLFARLMDKAAYEGRLFGDVSAVTQTNRAGTHLEALLRRTDWHRRLINGSDYPLPGVMPLFSPRRLAAEGFLTDQAARVVSAIRLYNPLLFDFVLKRSLIKDGHRFAPIVFESRRVLASIG